jgi:hypothetical protein
MGCRCLKVEEAATPTSPRPAVVPGCVTKCHILDVNSAAMQPLSSGGLGLRLGACCRLGPQKTPGEPVQLLVARGLLALWLPLILCPYPSWGPCVSMTSSPIRTPVIALSTPGPPHLSFTISAKTPLQARSYSEGPVAESWGAHSALQYSF